MGVCLSVVEQVTAPQAAPQNTPQSTPHAPRLSQIDPDTVPDVIFKNQLVDAKVVDCHDGDTVKVIMLHGNEPMKIAIRISGVDTPEITAGHGRLPEEKIAAQKARDFVIAQLGHRTRVRVEQYDKYGTRLIGRFILPDDTDLTDLLIGKGYARPYHGEKKHEWTLQELTTGPYA